jgi:hypothetical protein
MASEGNQEWADFLAGKRGIPSREETNRMLDRAKKQSQPPMRETPVELPPQQSGAPAQEQAPPLRATPPELPPAQAPVQTPAQSTTSAPSAPKEVPAQPTAAAAR